MTSGGTILSLPFSSGCSSLWFLGHRNAAFAHCFHVSVIDGSSPSSCLGRVARLAHASIIAGPAFDFFCAFRFSLSPFSVFAIMNPSFLCLENGGFAVGLGSPSSSSSSKPVAPPSFITGKHDGLRCRTNTVTLIRKELQTRKASFEHLQLQEEMRRLNCRTKVYFDVKKLAVCKDKNISIYAMKFVALGYEEVERYLMEWEFCCLRQRMDLVGRQDFVKERT
ncbi:hypothetical protein DVH24_035457 [Malus domestica]|uniref:Uncharacterized protein n=1 Tax=Malus domestica TaxID=3750 RepID=A0A498JA52_MALDO|nr:hypothetical protein DVH24_035457 [Malus domestica]